MVPFKDYIHGLFGRYVLVGGSASLGWASRVYSLGPRLGLFLIVSVVEDVANLLPAAVHLWPCRHTAVDSRAISLNPSFLPLLLFKVSHHSSRKVAKTLSLLRGHCDLTMEVSAQDNIILSNQSLKVTPLNTILRLSFHIHNSVD